MTEFTFWHYTPLPDTYWYARETATGNSWIYRIPGMYHNFDFANPRIETGSDGWEPSLRGVDDPDNKILTFLCKQIQQHELPEAVRETLPA